jgi:WD40 repeat protein
MTGVLGAQLASGFNLVARQVVGAATNGSTPAQVYGWNGDYAFNSSVGYTTPSRDFLPTNINGIDFAIDKSPSNSLISLGGSGLGPFDNRGYLSNFVWNFTTGFGTKLTNSPIMSVLINSVKFSPNGTRLAVGHSTSPFITVYVRNSNTIGSKRTDPATLPPSSVRSVEFSPSGDTIAFTHTDAPRLSAYFWNGDFGTKFADPAQLFQVSGKQLKFSPDGNYVAFIVGDNSPISVYPWSSSSGFGTRISSPALPVGASNLSLAFSPSGDTIIQGFSSTPFIYAYPWSPSGFGTRFANPSTLPGSSVQSSIFSGSGSQVIIGITSFPYLAVYVWSNGFGGRYSSSASATGIAYALSFATEKV